MSGAAGGEAAAGASGPLLVMGGVSKRFGAVVACEGIDLALRRGEVVALLGENGAGKTTLMNVLFGRLRADAGRVWVEQGGRLRPLPPGSPRAALDAGVAMVHQHFTLAENLTAIENVVLGRESLLAWRRAPARARVERLMAETGLAVPLDARVDGLGVGARQRVELLKALHGEARVLVLDEPTAVLAPAEADRLFETVRALAARGLGVILISHKLGEVMAAAHRVVVLAARAGWRARWPSRTPRPARSRGSWWGARWSVARARRPGASRARPCSSWTACGPPTPACAWWTRRWPCVRARSWAWPACRATGRRRSPRSWPGSRCPSGARSAWRAKRCVAPTREP